MTAASLSSVRRLAASAFAALAILHPCSSLARASSSEAASGVLVLAHGGRETWNAAVTALVTRVNERVPAEVAFGMAGRPAIQAAVDRLIARGVRDITVVPLFVSSHSSVVESSRYLLGLRPEAPADLAVFARMNHGGHGGGHGEHHGTPSADGTTPVRSTVPIRMGAALDDHPVVSDILAARARAISKDPTQEVVILVAHGPVAEDDNAKWLSDMAVHARRIGTAAPFARVEYLTVRDDAPEPIRGKATEELRRLVERATTGQRRALIVPLLISFGGIEQGIRKRLEGLEYTMAEGGLMPDDRLIGWVLQSAGHPGHSQEQ